MPDTLTVITNNVPRGWDGMRSDSFFSGLLVRYANDYESVVVGRYYF